eukprot:3068513-Alexandrium_andersonii.AAC.1
MLLLPRRCPLLRARPLGARQSGVRAVGAPSPARLRRIFGRSGLQLTLGALPRVLAPRPRSLCLQ